MTYKEARVYLDEVSKYGSVLGLDTIRGLLRELGNPQDDLEFIHIAGTNGKGSVLAYTSTILSEAGYRIGRYVSPTVVSYLERIQIDGKMITEESFAGLIQRMNKCLLSGIGFALIFGLSVCLYSQFLPETLTAFFTKDPAVVAMAAEYLRGYSIDCVVVSFVFCINSYFSGQGNSLFPMIHSLIATFLFRIPLSYWFSQIDSSSLFIMGFAPPISTVVSLFICIWYLRYTRKRNY